MEIAEQKVQVGGLTWFYRQSQPSGDSNRLPVVLLHGLVAQSYSWRGVMTALAEQGFPAFAPDWIGHGLSDHPDKRDFDYTPTAFLQAFGAWVEALELKQFHLITQGFLGTVGVLYALQNPERVDRLVMLNGPIAPEAKLPWQMRQFGVPLMGDMLTQDPLLVDRTLEGGGPYQVEDEDLDMYRRPFLKSSSAGRALMMTVKRLGVPQLTADIAAGLVDWDHPTLVVWGTSDPWLPVGIAQACVEQLPQGELVTLDQVGHYAQEDWAEKVAQAIHPFLRQMAV